MHCSIILLEQLQLLHLHSALLLLLSTVDSRDQLGCLMLLVLVLPCLLQAWSFLMSRASIFSGVLCLMTCRTGPAASIALWQQHPPAVTALSAGGAPRQQQQQQQQQQQ